MLLGIFCHELRMKNHVYCKRREWYHSCLLHMNQKRTSQALNSWRRRTGFAVCNAGRPVDGRSIWQQLSICLGQDGRISLGGLGWALEQRSEVGNPCALVLGVEQLGVVNGLLRMALILWYSGSGSRLCGNTTIYKLSVHFSPGLRYVLWESELGFGWRDKSMNAGRNLLYSMYLLFLVTYLIILIPVT